MLEKLTELLTKIFNFIKGLASAFVNDLDKLPIKGGLEWLIVILLISLVLLTLSSVLSSFFRASGEFLKNAAKWLRLVVFIGTITVSVFVLFYWIVLSNRPCFSKNPDLETKWTFCKPASTSTKGKK
jgi:O-antigen/teichoic acid export membrane protein